MFSAPQSNAHSLEGIYIMRRLGTVFAFTLLLFTYDVFAEDVYISGNDGVALQAAIDAANTPGSQVTIHLEAGQVFDVIPSFFKIFRQWDI